MAKQTSPKTTLSSASFQLQTLDANSYYNATLSGGTGTSATAHTSIISPLLTTLKGDTLITTGSNSTLLGGAGYDSLIALGKSNYLAAGTGLNTLVGSTVKAYSDTLVGNGHSLLVGRGSNDTFLLNFNGDKISEGLGGINSVRTSINNFSLSDTANHGAGVLNIQNLIYSGAGGATLKGNSLNGSLIGGTTGANSLVAGSGIETLIGGGTPIIHINDTLVGNGKSSLVAGYGNDVLIINTPGDKIYIHPSSIVGGATVTAGTETILTTATKFSLADSITSGIGVLQTSTLAYNGTLTSGTVTLYGNAYSNTIIAAANTSNYLVSGGGYESLVGGGSNDTLVGDKNSTLNGGAGDNTYYVYGQGDVIQDTGSTINGGTVFGYSNGLVPFTYNLAYSGNQTGGITTLEYTGAAAATLMGNGNRDTIIGGIGGSNSLLSGSGGASLVGNGRRDTLNDGGYPSTLSGDSKTTIYIVTNAKDVIQQSVGGNGTILTSLNAYSLSTVAGGESVQNLTYSGASAATLIGNNLSNVLNAGSATSATLISDDLAAGASYGSGGFDTMIGSATGDNLFEIITPSDLGGLTSIQGGLGSDTLHIFSAGALGDNVFGVGSTQFITNVQTLELSSPSAVTLGAAAALTGISTVIGSSGGDSFTQTSLNGNALYLQGGFGGFDFFSVAAGELANDTLLGGDLGSNTLQVIGPDLIDDFSFVNVSSIKTLELSSPSSVLLDIYAQNANISQIVGGSGGDTFNQTVNDPLALTLIGGNSAANTFNIATASELANDFISGGGSGDILSIATAGIISDSTFANVTGIKALSLTSASSVNLGTNAVRAGFSTVISGSGSDTFNASAFTGPLTFNASASTTGTILIGSSSNDLFQVGGANALTGSSIVGGAGIDTLQITQSAPQLLDSCFTQVTGIKALSLTSASSVNLDSHALLAGFTSIVGGSGGDTFNQTVNDPLALTLIGGNSAANTFNIATASELANDFISGGGSGDILSIATAGIISDSTFANVTGIKALSLTSASSVNLGTNAVRAGFSSFVGGTGGDTFTQTVSDTLHLTFVGGNSAANTFNIATALELSNDNISGGTSNNILSLQTGGYITDSTFANVTGIKTLSLTSSTSVILGAEAAGAGFSTIYGGTGSDTFNATGDSSNLTIQGFSGAAAVNKANDSIIGGSGADIFVLANTGDTNNAYGNGGSNVATINNFIAGSSADILQLHDFGGGVGNTGPYAYHTLYGGVGIIDVYNYMGSAQSNEVAVLHITSGTFTWDNNAKFV